MNNTEVPGGIVRDDDITLSSSAHPEASLDIFCIPTWLGLFKYPCTEPGAVGSHPLPVAGLVLQVRQAELVIRQLGAVHTSTTVGEGYKQDSPKLN